MTSESDARWKELEAQLRVAVRRTAPDWLRQDSEDLVQTGLIRLSTAVDEGRAINASYVWKVAWSVVMDAKRRRRRRPEHGEDALERVAGGPTPEALTRRRRLRDAIEACLGELREVARDCVSLHLLGHTIVETAQMLGLTRKQADNRIYRGLASVRECLARKGFAPGGDDDGS